MAENVIDCKRRLYGGMSTKKEGKLRVPNLLGSRSFPLPLCQNFIVKCDVRIPWDSYFTYCETWIL